MAPGKPWHAYPVKISSKNEASRHCQINRKFAVKRFILTEIVKGDFFQGKEMMIIPERGTEMQEGLICNAKDKAKAFDCMT